jgi:hypothetical protein
VAERFGDDQVEALLHERDGDGDRRNRTACFDGILALPGEPHGVRESTLGKALLLTHAS